MLKKQYLFLLVVVLILNACSSDSGDDELSTCPPLELLSSNVNSTQIFFGTSNSSSANSFEVEYGITGFTLGTGTRFTTSNSLNISGLTPNTTYDVYVTSICSAQDRSVPASLLAITTDPSQCQFNTTIETNQLNLNSINVNLSFSSNASAQEFEYEYGLEGFTLGSGTVITNPSSNVNLTDFEPSTTYDIYARAICSSTDISTYGMTTFTTSDSCPPPTGLQAIFNGGSCGNRQYTLNWDYIIASSNASFFDISIPNNESIPPVSQFTTSSTQITLSPFSCDDTRYFYVRANCLDGNVSEWAGPIPFN